MEKILLKENLSIFNLSVIIRELSDDDMKIEISFKRKKVKVTSPVTPSPIQDTPKILTPKEQLKEV